jgi:hypothetical protein
MDIGMKFEMAWTILDTTKKALLAVIVYRVFHELQ